MKKNILLTIAVLFISAMHTYGITPADTYLDFGIQSIDFEVSDLQSSKQLNNLYGDTSAPDVVYSFKLATTMDITISHCGSTVQNTYLYLLDSQMNKIDENDDSYDQGACQEPHQAFLSRKGLPAGTYYVISEAYLVNYPKEEYIVTNIKGTISRGDGNTMLTAIDLGVKSADFLYTDIKDTRLYTNNNLEIPTNDVFYKITLNIPLDIVISHENSDLSDTCIRLFHEQGYEIVMNDDSWDTGSSSNHKQAFMRIYSLSPGIYYILSEGKFENGCITTRISGEVSESEAKGDTMNNAIDIGLKTADFSFTDTQSSLEFYTDTYNCALRDEDAYGNDIFYKFTLSRAMDITLTHEGSEICDTYLHLLDDSGSCIAHDNSGYMPDNISSALSWNDLPAGSYYVVSEGYWNEGYITTTIKGSVDYSIKTSEDQNYILTTVPQVEASDIKDVPTGNKIQYVEYYDGLGRPMQKVEVNAGGSKTNDLVSYTEYDLYGRESCRWLPVPVDENDGAFISYADLKKKATDYYGDKKAYSKNVYENSALNRITEEYGPGEAWHNNRRSIKTSYLGNIVGNDTLNCIHYVINELTNDTLSTLTKLGNYDSFELFVTRMEDEDRNVSFEFRDKRDKLLLSRQVEKKGTMLENYDTYYIYDKYGNLVAVLPPEASDIFSRSKAKSWYSATDTTLLKYVYLYKYGLRNQCQAKKLPGCGWVLYIYDKGGRLIFSQDAEQRKSGFWTFTIPDAYKRICLTGTCQNSLLEAFPILCLDTIVEARRNNDTNIYKGYKLAGITLKNPQVLTVNYYDDYAFMGKNGIPPHTDSSFDYNVMNGFNREPTTCSKTFLTGTLTAQLNSSHELEYLFSVMYYDSFGRMIQKKSTTHLAEGVLKEYMAYNFVGQPIRKYHEYTISGHETLSELNRYFYDHSGRLSSVKHQLNGEEEIVLVDNSYDALGRLEVDSRNGEEILRTDYTYNIRSWLTSISCPLFSQTLHYEEGLGTCYYNGNIGSFVWKTGKEDVLKGYQFSYDNLNRLTTAKYGEGAALSQNCNHFNEEITKYDKMGNILGLLRYGRTSSGDYGLVDELKFNLDGNRLRSVDDASTASSYGNGSEFKDGASFSVEYSYDANGNLTQDLNKKITYIQYNLLNLPCRIEFEDGNCISYVYDANGTKLRSAHVLDGITTITDYCGSVIYENGIAKTLLVELGYVSLTDGKYHFYLKDHQRNNRLVVDEDGKVEEQNDYYPFGGLMSSSTVSVQPYKYNGKELDRKGGLDWYDYGARYYDAVLGRWHVVDPMAEKYYDESLYGYCGNNSVNKTDLNGMLYDGFTIDKDGYFKLVNKEGGNEYDVIYNKERYSSETLKDYDELGDKTGIKISKGILSGTTGNNNMSTKRIKGIVKTQDGYDSGKTISNHAYEVKTDKEAVSIMNFLDKNTDVEWNNTFMKDGQGNTVNLLGTSHQSNTVLFGSHQVNKYVARGFQVMRADHIHPSSTEVSTNDKLHGQDVLIHSPKAIFRILHKGNYFEYKP